jgi:hypothetical protein
MVKAQKLALCIDILAESDSRSVVNIPERLGFQPLPTSGRLARDHYASMTRSTGGGRKRNGFRSLLRLGRAGVVERDDVHFPNRLFQQGLGNDSDVPRIFVLNLACASG